MKRSFLSVYVAFAALAVGVTLAYAIEYLAGSTSAQDFRWSAFLLVGVGTLFVLGRTMFDNRYGQTGGTGVKDSGKRLPLSRDISHLPGRSHQTFTQALRQGAAATIGSLQILQRTRIGGHLIM
jgi:hypothetical protein